MSLGLSASNKDRNTKSHSQDSPTVPVVGCRGMLGQDLMKRLEMNGLFPAGLDLPEIDITKPEGVFACFKALKPQVVVNCAAYTAVDRAESESGVAFAVNRDGAENLARTCSALGIPLIHISTDYVFDGSSKEPYREHDPAKPLGVYALSKWEGEEAIRRVLPQHVIMRTAWMFGAHGPSFVKTMLRLARDKEELRVVADQRGCPTWTVDLADALVLIILKIVDGPGGMPWGTYHFCGTGETTWHGFAEEILEEGRRYGTLKTVRVVPIATVDYPTPAQRPAYSVLDCQKIGNVFGIIPPSWRLGLKEVVREICLTSSG